MNTQRGHRRPSALLIASVLALAGGLGAAAPAAAAPGDLVVLTPVEGTVYPTHEVDFTGTGTPAAEITLTFGSAPEVFGSTTVGATGDWGPLSLILPYQATEDQIAHITQVAGDVEQTVSVSFSITTGPSDPNEIVTTSPLNLSTLDGVELVVTGTAPAGSVLTYYLLESTNTETVSVAVDDDGTFVTPARAIRPSSDRTPVLVSFTGVTPEGAEIYGPGIAVYPAPLLPAPVLATPTPGSSVVGDSVTFRGTATPGETVVVTIYSATDGTAARSDAALIDASGEWETTIDSVLPGSYSTSAVLEYRDAETTFTTSAPSDEFTFSLSTSTPTGQKIVITSPTQGETIDSDFVTFAGTAPVGSTIAYTDTSGGDGLLTLTVDETGTFAVEMFAGRSDGGFPYTLYAEGTTIEGAALARASVEFYGAPYLPAPVVISPAAGSTVTGKSITFTGTGTPGEKLVVSAYVPGLPLGEFEKYSRTSPTVVVDAQGHWKATIDLLPATYTTSAALVYDDGGLAAVISASSPDQQITLRATAPAGPPVLAATGTDLGDAFGLTALLLLAGGALVAVRRRSIRVAG